MDIKSITTSRGIIDIDTTSIIIAIAINITTHQIAIAINITTHQDVTTLQDGTVVHVTRQTNEKPFVECERLFLNDKNLKESYKT